MITGLGSVLRALPPALNPAEIAILRDAIPDAVLENENANTGVIAPNVNAREQHRRSVPHVVAAFLALTTCYLLAAIGPYLGRTVTRIIECEKEHRTIRTYSSNVASRAQSLAESQMTMTMLAMFVWMISESLRGFREVMEEGLDMILDAFEVEDDKEPICEGDRQPPT